MIACEQPKNEVLSGTGEELLVAGCRAEGSEGPREGGVAKLEEFRNTNGKNKRQAQEVQGMERSAIGGDHQGKLIRWRGFPSRCLPTGEDGPAR